MRVLLATTELASLAKVGGIGDVVEALAKKLRLMGHDARVIMPYYGTLAGKLSIPGAPVWSATAMGAPFDVYQTEIPENKVPLYLVGHPSFAPQRVYGGLDENWRFTFFSSAATEFLLSRWKPDIVHCHDWQTGMIPVWLHTEPGVGTVFTIHNMAYQGPWRAELERITWCPPWMEGHNTMSAAVQFADRVNTVSPTYAEQIKTPEYGEKLEGLLSFVSGKLSGILNGIDPEVFDPSTDRAIERRFTAETLSERVENKRALQKRAGLAQRNDAFLLGLVSRLVPQKGIDLISQVMDPFLSYTDTQVVILGTGDPHYEHVLWHLGARHPGRVSTNLMYNDAFARAIYAGADAFLMPSRFEPCGISQLIAMRYGCIPIVRRTGGLVDTVEAHDPIAGKGTGYCFDRYEPLDLYTSMTRAWEGFLHKPQWLTLQKRAMAADFSWDESAKRYVELYEAVVGER